MTQVLPTAIVIGGGIAGLVAARELAISGFGVTVLEAADHFGGSVYSHELAGLTLDAGAESFATRSTAVADLLKDLGIEQSIVPPLPGGSYLYTTNAHGEPEAFPSPQSGIMGIPGDPQAEDVVVVIGEQAAREAARDLDTPVDPALLEGPISFGDLVRARLGETMLERLVTPVVAGVLSAHPDVLDADAVSPGLRKAMAREGSLSRAAASLRKAAPAGSAVAGIHGGMRMLPEILVSDLRDRGAELLLSAPVQSVTRGDDGSWRIETAEDSFATEKLVVATDGTTAAGLLSAEFAAAEAVVPQETGAPIALVTLMVDAPELDSHPRGTGLLVAPGTKGVTAKALTHASAKWKWLAEAAGPGTHVVRLSYGRLDDAVPANFEDERLIETGIKDASILLGVELASADVVDADVVRFTGGLPFATPGHRAAMQDLRAAVEGNNEGLQLVGAWLAGTGLAAVVADTRGRVSVNSR
ncbi:protoporphyrinogen oxidase [Neomicrococcus lactis]